MYTFDPKSRPHFALTSHLLKTSWAPSLYAANECLPGGLQAGHFPTKSFISFHCKMSSIRCKVVLWQVVSLYYVRMELQLTFSITLF